MDAEAEELVVGAVDVDVTAEVVVGVVDAMGEEVEVARLGVVVVEAASPGRGRGGFGGRGGRGQ